MKNLLAFFIISCIFTCPLAAMEEGAAARVQSSADQITIQLTDGEIQLDKARFLPVLKQSKTISDFLEDVQTDVIAFPLPNITKGDFEVALSLMVILKQKNENAIELALDQLDVKKLSTYWDIFNYLDVPDLLKSVNTDLTQKLVAQVKQNPQAIPELFEQIPEQFKRSQTGIPIAELPDYIKPHLITQLTMIENETIFPDIKSITSAAIDPFNRVIAIAYAAYQKGGIKNVMLEMLRIDDLENVKIHNMMGKQNIKYLAFDSKRNLLIALTDDNINIFDFSNFEKIRKISELNFESSKIGKSSSFDPMNNLIAVGDDKKVNIYNISNPHAIKLIKKFEIPGEAESSVFDSEHNLLVIGSSKGAFINAISNPVDIKDLNPDQEDRVISVDIYAKRQLLAMGSDRGAALYDISDPSNSRKLMTTPIRKYMPTVAFDSMHDLLSLSDENTEIYNISDLNNIEKLATVSGWSAFFDPHNSLLITTLSKRGIILYDLTLLDKFKALTFEQMLVVRSMLSETVLQRLTTGGRAAISYFLGLFKKKVPEEMENIFKTLDPRIQELITK